MSEKPEALEVAADLRGRIARHPSSDTTRTLLVCDDAARCLEKQHAEIERLHKENERLQNTKHYEAPFGFVLNPDYLVPELKAENERLRGLVRHILGDRITPEAYLLFGKAWVDEAHAALRKEDV